MLPSSLDLMSSTKKQSNWAHPNEQGIRNAMQVKDFRLGSYASNHLLMIGAGAGLQHVLDRTHDAGVLALDLLGEVFPERYAAVGIAARLAGLTHATQKRR